MRIKSAIILFVLVCYKTVCCQEECPVGYELKKVRCNEGILDKCVPQNYSSDNLWTVKWDPCPGQKLGGENSFHTYQEALEVAQKGENNNNWDENGNCHWWDSKKYVIYLDDQKFCGTSLETDKKLKEDFKNKISGFLKRYNAEISNYASYYSKGSYPPGAVTKEYASVLDKAVQNARDLQEVLHTIDGKSIAEIQSDFNEALQVEQTLNNTFSGRSSSSSSDITNNTNGPVRQKKIEYPAAQASDRDDKILDNDLNKLNKLQTDLANGNINYNQALNTINNINTDMQNVADREENTSNTTSDNRDAAEDAQMISDLQQIQQVQNRVANGSISPTDGMNRLSNIQKKISAYSGSGNSNNSVNSQYRDINPDNVNIIQTHPSMMSDKVKSSRTAENSFWTESNAAPEGNSSSNNFSNANPRNQTSNPVNSFFNEVERDLSSKSGNTNNSLFNQGNTISSSQSDVYSRIQQIYANNNGDLLKTGAAMSEDAQSHTGKDAATEGIAGLALYGVGLITSAVEEKNRREEQRQAEYAAQLEEERKSNSRKAFLEGLEFNWPSNADPGNERYFCKVGWDGTGSDNFTVYISDMFIVKRAEDGLWPFKEDYMRGLITQGYVPANMKSYGVFVSSNDAIKNMAGIAERLRVMGPANVKPVKIANNNKDTPDIPKTSKRKTSEQDFWK